MIIGSCLGDRYKILEMIGGGGMATVYRAFDNILEREVAVKILRQDLALDERAVKRFRREAQSALTLSHPNIVSIYDIGEGEGTYYIVMEYVKGLTLKDYIQNNHPIPLEEALLIMEQIASAISHAHEYQIIHRDIKPQNILIDTNGNIKITDFGIAMLLQSATMTQTNTTIGSVHYLSPEQANGSVITYQTDIYSMGILFYELFAGAPPFQGESAVAVALHHIQTPVPSIRILRPEIPQSVENIILKAAAKDLKHRYHTVQEMVRDINECLQPDRLNVLPYRPEAEDLEKTKPASSVFDDSFIQEIEPVSFHTNISSSVREDEHASNLNTNPSVSSVPKPWYQVQKNQILLVFFVFVIIVLGIFLSFHWFGKEEVKEVEIPDIIDMTLEEAEQELEKYNLIVDKVIEQNSEEIEEGKVIKTNPSIGALVKENFPITVFVSLGMEKAAVSNYEGLLYPNLKEQLEGIFKEVQVIEEISDQTPGTILQQTPRHGEEVVLADTVLNLVIAKEEPKPKGIVLENFEGKVLSELESFANANHLKVQIQEQYHDSVEKGKIISHTPGAGNTIQENGTITVVVSKGEEEKPPKVVYVQVSLPFDYDINKEVQEVVIYIKDLNRSINQPALHFDITEDTEESFEMTIPYGETGEYRIVREGAVIQQKVINYPNS